MAPKRRKGDGDDTENDAKRAKTGDQTSGEPAEPEKAAPKKKKPLPKHFADVQPLVDEAKKRDGDDKSKKATDDDMVEKLALHLASTPQMIEWIKSPTQLSQINVSFWFLANVHLEHRWKRYQDIQSFYQSFWQTKMKKKWDVLERAQEILIDAVDFANTSIDNARAPLPSNEPRDQTLRKQLFILEVNRQKMVEAIRVFTNNQHALARDLRNAIGGHDEAKRSSVVKELGLLETVKQELRIALSRSQLNNTGIQILDDCLYLVPQRPGASDLLYTTGSKEADLNKSTERLMRLEDEAGPDELSAGGATSILASQGPSHKEVIDKIAKKYSFTPNYIEKPTAEQLAKDVFTLTSATSKDVAKSIQRMDAITGPFFVNAATLADCDKACAKWLEDESANFNRDFFQLTFREFEGVLDRPEPCIRADKHDLIWRWKPTMHLVVVKDNMWHVRHHVADLVECDLLRESKTSVGYDEVLNLLQQTLRRMWALLALMYGCCREVGLLCTVMDRLLEDLAELLVGHVDPHLETIAMQKVVEAIASTSAEKQETSNFLKTPELLERHHRARVVFSEIARFYHGAIIIGVSKVSATYHHTSKEEKQTWYEELLKLMLTCGHPSCKEQIQVKRMDWGVKTEQKSAPKKGKKKISRGADDPAEDADIMNPPEGAASASTPVKAKTKWSVSIAIKDARVGFPEERAHLSKNRLAAYPCLSAFLHNIKYNVALGVFFHYFTHLYHPTCRPFRGKYGLVDDVSLFLPGGSGGAGHGQGGSGGNNEDEDLYD